MGASGRTLVIGDVHGCRDEAEDLLARCHHTPDDDVVFVGYLRAKAAGEPNPYLKPSHKPVVDALLPHHIAYLESLPLWIELPEHNALVVHAGLVPGVALPDQEPGLLLNIRTLRSDGTGSKGAEDGALWGTQWHGPTLVIFGHHALAGFQQHPFAIGLDTGCCYGRELTACILPERTFVAVPARQAYAPIAGRNG